MSLSILAEQRLTTLRETAWQWASKTADIDALLARELVDVVRAEVAEPVSLAQLEQLAQTQVADVASADLRVERRQRPDPCGEGSLGYYVLLQTLPMTDAQYETKIDQLWARRERALLAARGVDREQLALYRRLHAQFGHREDLVV